MKDALGQQIHVGDYVAYSLRNSVAVVRVERIEEYTDWRTKAVRMVGKYAVARLTNRFSSDADLRSVEWIIKNGGHRRPLCRTERAVKIAKDHLPAELIELLAG